MPENPMVPIVTLGERLREIAAEIGLDLKQFVPVVDFEHSGHMIQAVFVYNEPVAVASAEQAEFDATFKELAAEFVAEKEEDKVSDTAQKMLELRDRLRKGKSILDDGDDAGV